VGDALGIGCTCGTSFGGPCKIHGGTVLPEQSTTAMPGGVIYPEDDPVLEARVTALEAQLRASQEREAELTDKLTRERAEAQIVIQALYAGEDRLKGELAELTRERDALRERLKLRESLKSKDGPTEADVQRAEDVAREHGWLGPSMIPPDPRTYDGEPPPFEDDGVGALEAEAADELAARQAAEAQLERVTRERDEYAGAVGDSIAERETIERLEARAEAAETTGQELREALREAREALVGSPPGPLTARRIIDRALLSNPQEP
jgi:hypothetical protein